MKILEEAKELAEAKSRAEVLNELVDLQELVNEHRRLLGLSPSRFAVLLARKRRERGGFVERLFLEYVDDRPSRIG